ncbi:MAG: serine/threonine protein kinase [Anaerolineae bacterium]|nr:serine/threonine protein kinase [Anaerolineae bacterium]
MAEATPGSNRFGPFIVQEKLGGGGMAVVYKAVHEQSGATVALKILRGSIAEQPGMADRFKQEATIVNRLRHPHIVTVHNYGVIRGRPYMELEYMSGGTLAQRFKQPAEIGPQEAVRLLRHVASALDYAHHQGVVHRDIKLENILLDGRGVASLADFGIARLIDSTHLTATGSIIGTPLYLSPEQANGGKDVDSRSDLYSLAVIAYLLAVGHFPFNGSNALSILNQHLSSPVPPPSSVNPDLPKALDAVLLKGMAKRPEERYQLADTFVEAFSRSFNDHQIRSTRIDLWSDHSGKQMAVRPITLPGESAEDWFQKALKTKEKYESIGYLKRALEIDPLHSKANRLLFQVEGANPNKKQEQPRQTPAPIEPGDLEPLKKVRQERKRSPWTYIALASFMLMNATLMLVVLLSQGQAGGITGFFDTLRGTAAPVLSIEGTRIADIPDIVLTIEPIKSEMLRTEAPLSDVLDTGRVHEYRFNAASGSEVDIGIRFFSSTAHNIVENIAVVNPAGEPSTQVCQQDSIMGDGADLALICSISMSGTWRIRLLGIEGESTGAYVISMIEF